MFLECRLPPSGDTIFPPWKIVNRSFILLLYVCFESKSVTELHTEALLFRVLQQRSISVKSSALITVTTQDLQGHAATPSTEDPRWQLVQKIVSSRNFVKSSFLSSFLL